MNKEFGSYIKSCRKAALLTQEEAAYKLHISTRSLAAYESEETVTPEDMIIAMTELYNSKAIAFYYLKYQNAVGKLFLPDFKTENIATAVIRLKKEIMDIQKMEYRILEIASDGKVDESEKKDWEEIQKKIEEAAAAALAIRFL